MRPKLSPLFFLNSVCLLRSGIQQWKGTVCFQVLCVLGMGMVMGLPSCSNPFDEQRPISETPPLLDRSQDMSILRTDFKRAASIRFFTIHPAYCRIQYWSVSLGDNPPEKQRREASCFREKTLGRSHFVRLERLKPDDPQYIRLLVSSTDQEVEKSDDRLILKETAGAFSYFPPKIKDQIEEDGAIAVTVVKANLTQASAGIYSNLVLDKDFDEQKRQFVKKSKGCKVHSPSPYGQLLPPREIGLSSLSTSGYYSTSGIELDKKRGVYLLDFTGKHEPAIHWLFRFNINGSDKYYKVPSPPEFRSVKLIQKDQDITLLRHDLIQTPRGVTVGAEDGEVTFSWKSRNVLVGDFVEILVGKPSLGPSIRCQFSAQDKEATLTTEDLEKVGGVMKDVVVSMNRKLVSDDQDGHVVFLHTHDWRHARMQFP